MREVKQPPHTDDIREWNRLAIRMVEEPGSPAHGIRRFKTRDTPFLPPFKVAGSDIERRWDK
jgi:hypothetical protein